MSFNKKIRSAIWCLPIFLGANIMVNAMNTPTPKKSVQKSGYIIGAHGEGFSSPKKRFQNKKIINYIHWIGEENEQLCKKCSEKTKELFSLFENEKLEERYCKSCMSAILKKELSKANKENPKTVWDFQEYINHVCRNCKKIIPVSNTAPAYICEFIRNGIKYHRYYCQECLSQKKEELSSNWYIVKIEPSISNMNKLSKNLSLFYFNNNKQNSPSLTSEISNIDNNQNDKVYLNCEKDVAWFEENFSSDHDNSSDTQRED